MNWITRSYPLGGRTDLIGNALGTICVINSVDNREVIYIDAHDFVRPHDKCVDWEEVPPEIKDRMQNIANLIAGTLNMLGV